jgi:hypothetical protein
MVRPENAGVEFSEKNCTLAERAAAGRTRDLTLEQSSGGVFLAVSNMVFWFMGKATKSSGRVTGAYTVGRQRFSKISSVEGIRTSRRVDEDFQEFDRKGLSAEERRREIVRKYGRKS